MIALSNVLNVYVQKQILFQKSLWYSDQDSEITGMRFRWKH